MKAKTDRLAWLKTREKGMLKASTSGIYYYRIHANSRQYWGSLGTSDFKIAKAQLRKKTEEIKGSAELLKSITEGKITIAGLADLYKQRSEADVSIKASTKEDYAKAVETIKRTWPNATQKARDVTKHDIEIWSGTHLKTRSGKQYSAQKHNTAVDVMRRMFDLALERGIIPRNPVTDIPKIKPRPKKVNPPTPEEFQTLVDNVSKGKGWCSRQVGDLLEFMAYTGTRVGEARNVKWSDVNDNGLWIRGDLENDGTKNRESRFLPMNKGLKRLLDDLKANPRHYRGDRSEYVLALQQADKAIKRACAAIGIAPITHHTCRHYFCTMAILDGVHIEALRQMLGHKDTNLISKTYGHLLNDHLAKEAAKLSF